MAEKEKKVVEESTKEKKVKVAAKSEEAKPAAKAATKKVTEGTAEPKTTPKKVAKPKEEKSVIQADEVKSEAAPVVSNTEKAKAAAAKKEAKVEVTEVEAETKPAKKEVAEEKPAKAEKAKPAKEEAKVEAKAEKKPVAKKEKNTGANNNRLKQRYLEVVVPLLMKEFNYKSIMEVPHIEKVVINMGVGDAASNSKLIEEAIKDLTSITGQKPVATKSKKAIASFKLRENVAIGCKVTLRGAKMYEFIDKLVSISLPRVRDFRGINKNSFDGRGNYTLGIKEQLIFPEIKYENVTKIRGMDIIIVTTADSDKEAFALLSNLGMPFQK